MLKFTFSAINALYDLLSIEEKVRDNGQEILSVIADIMIDEKSFENGFDGVLEKSKTLMKRSRDKPIN